MNRLLIHLAAALLFAGAAAAQDADSDGVPDGSDNCPSDYNPGQEDWDSDGVGNVCQCEYPTTTWATWATPEDGGFDSSGLAALEAAVGGEGLIIRDGKIAYSWGDTDNQQNRDWASATKALHGVLMWDLIEDGAVDVAEDDDMSKWLSGIDDGSPNPKDYDITIYHLMHMISGYGLIEDPGDAYAYNDDAIALLMNLTYDYILAAGTTPVNHWLSRFSFLTMQNTPHVDGSGSGLGRITDMSAEDAARHGLLWFTKGYWIDTQEIGYAYWSKLYDDVIPLATPHHSGTTADDTWDFGSFGGGPPWDDGLDGPGNYSWGFWVNTGQRLWPNLPADAFQANGHWGDEVITVIPSRGIVAVGIEGTWDLDDDDGPIDTALDMLMAADIAEVGAGDEVTHYIEGLQPGWEYTLFEDAAEVGSETAGDDGTVTITESNAGTGDYQLVQGEDPPDETPPDPVTGVIATPDSESQMTWSWNPATDPSGIDHYEVTVTVGPAGPLFAYGETAAGVLQLQFEGMTPETEYCARVVAVDGALNDSDPSAEVCETTLAGAGDTTPPPTPTGLIAMVNSSTAITWSWNPVSDAGTGGSDPVDYTITIREGPAGAVVATVTDIATTSYQRTGLDPATQYCARVTAVDTEGNESSQSAQVCASTNAAADTTPPPTPTGLVATVLDHDSIRWQWDPVTDDASNPCTYSITVRDGATLPLRGDPLYDPGSLTVDEVLWVGRLDESIIASWDTAKARADSDDTYELGRYVNDYVGALLMGLRATGDLAYLDSVAVLTEIARADLADAWDDATTDGYLNWRWRQGTPGDGLHGTDTHEMDDAMTHGMVALVAHAFDVNRDLDAGYAEKADFWLGYLEDHFLAKWTDRAGGFVEAWETTSGFYKRFTHPRSNQLRVAHYLGEITGDAAYESRYQVIADQLAAHPEAHPSFPGAVRWTHQVAGADEGWQEVNYANYFMRVVMEMYLEGRVDFGYAAMKAYATTFRDVVFNDAPTHATQAEDVNGDGSEGAFADGFAGLDRWIDGDDLIDVAEATYSAGSSGISVAGYALLAVATRGGDVVATSIDQAGTSFTANGLTPETEYWATVTATDAASPGNESDPTVEVSATTEAAPVSPGGGFDTDFDLVFDVSVSGATVDSLNLQVFSPSSVSLGWVYWDGGTITEEADGYYVTTFDVDHATAAAGEYRGRWTAFAGAEEQSTGDKAFVQAGPTYEPWKAGVEAETEDGTAYLTSEAFGQNALQTAFLIGFALDALQVDVEDAIDDAEALLNSEINDVAGEAASATVTSMEGSQTGFQLNFQQWTSELLPYMFQVPAGTSIWGSGTGDFGLMVKQARDATASTGSLHTLVNQTHTNALQIEGYTEFLGDSLVVANAALRASRDSLLTVSDSLRSALVAIAGIEASADTSAIAIAVDRRMAGTGSEMATTHGTGTWATADLTATDAAVAAVPGDVETQLADEFAGISVDVPAIAGATADSTWAPYSRAWREKSAHTVERADTTDVSVGEVELDLAAVGKAAADSTWGNYSRAYREKAAHTVERADTTDADVDMAAIGSAAADSTWGEYSREYRARRVHTVERADTTDAPTLAEIWSAPDRTITGGTVDSVSVVVGTGAIAHNLLFVDAESSSPIPAAWNAVYTDAARSVLFDSQPANAVGRIVVEAFQDVTYYGLARVQGYASKAYEYTPSGPGTETIVELDHLAATAPATVDVCNVQVFVGGMNGQGLKGVEVRAEYAEGGFAGMLSDSTWIFASGLRDTTDVDGYVEMPIVWSSVTGSAVNFTISDAMRRRLGGAIAESTTYGVTIPDEEETTLGLLATPE